MPAFAKGAVQVNSAIRDREAPNHLIDQHGQVKCSHPRPGITGIETHSPSPEADPRRARSDVRWQDHCATRPPPRLAELSRHYVPARQNGRFQYKA